jgi:hypothetical protein
MSSSRRVLYFGDCLAGAILTVSVNAIAFAQAPDVVAAYYSDACLNEQSGDLHGDRIAVVKSGDGYFVRFQAISGQLPDEIKGTATVKGDELRFEVDTSYGEHLVFIGKITPDEVTGRFVNGRLGTDHKPDIHLRRLASAVFNTGDCH